MRHVTIKFLQAILNKEKKHFTQAQAPTRSIPRYPEFSVRHMIKNGYVDNTTVSNYFPDDPLKMDREFFWAVWNKVAPEKASKYIQKVIT